MKSFAQIKDGDRVVIEPTILVFAVVTAKPGTTQPFSVECERLMKRCRVKEVQGIISSLALTRFWKELEALSFIKSGSSIRDAAQKAIIEGSTAGVAGLDAGKRVLALAESSLSVVTVEREDYRQAVELTRDLVCGIDAALTIAAVERVYGQTFGVATALDHFKSLHDSGRCKFEIFQPTDAHRRIERDLSSYLRSEKARH